MNNNINSKVNELIELYIKVKSILIKSDMILDIESRFSFLLQRYIIIKGKFIIEEINNTKNNSNIKFYTNLGYISLFDNKIYLSSKLLDYITKIKRIVSLIKVLGISETILISNKFILFYFYILGYLNRKLIMVYLVRDIYIIDNL